MDLNIRSKMSKTFIELTDAYDDGTVYINPAYITAVRYTSNWDNSSIVCTVYTMDNCHDVKETPEEVIKIIEEHNGN